jgi:hypothetical protein
MCKIIATLVVENKSPFTLGAFILLESYSSILSIHIEQQ